MIRINTYLLMLVLSTSLFSCKDKDPLEENTAQPSAPTTFNFENVNYSGQTLKLLMLENLESRMATVASNPLTDGELKKYFDSTNTYFNIETSLGSKNLEKDFLASNAGLKQQWTDSIYSWIDSIETRSINGKTNPLIREDSVHLSQAIAKTIMGGLFYDQAVNKYLVNLTSADNATVTAGKGTSMEHQFDEAFGYFGAARDYNNYTDAEKVNNSFNIDSDGNGTQNPSTEKIFKYYAQTAAKRDNANLGTDFTKTLFDAFLLGRFSISTNNFAMRDAAISTIKDNWEAIIAATVLHYINDVKADADGSVNKSIHWSEMKFYFNTISFYPSNKLGSANIAALNTKFGNRPSEADDTALTEAAEIIRAAYSFTDNQRDNW